MHEVQAVLGTLSMEDLLAVQAATEIIGRARALAAPFPQLATLIKRAGRVLNGEGDAGILMPERRLAEAKALIVIAHEEIHVEDPHARVDPRVN